MKRRFDIEVANPTASHKPTIIISLLDSHPEPSKRKEVRVTSLISIDLDSYLY